MRPTDTCPGCGARFSSFKTGLNFTSVSLMMRTHVEGQYRAITRRAVLGFWHELKIHMWQSNHSECAAPVAAEVA